MQKSIDESVYKVLVDIIHKYELTAYFDIKKTTIRNIQTGYDFIFHGLRDLTVDSVKSMKGITEVWAEEAHAITTNSWQTLKPTIREESCVPYYNEDGTITWGDSELWVSFNRKRIDDPVWEEFCSILDEDTIIIHVNWYDNPFFPEVLRKEKDRDYTRNPELARHIWEGEPLSVDGIVYSQFSRKKNVISAKEAMFFERKADEQIIGIDWGYDHPMAMTKINRLGERYVISREYKKREQPITISWLFDDMVGFAGQAKIAICDSARPEHINFCDRKYKEETKERHEIRFKGCHKGPGSVIQEINTLNRLFADSRLLISEDCTDLIKEIETWLWKPGMKNETPTPLGEDLCRSVGYGIMSVEKGMGSVEVL